MPDAAVDKLRDFVSYVEATYDRQRARLQQQIIRDRPHGDGDFALRQPEDMLDTLGRPILLDAQVALLNAMCVLAQHDGVTIVVKHPAPRP